MEFWGVEVKPNQTVKCEPGEEKLLHLSLAALGESKKATENVVTYVTFNNQKLIIGTLSSEKCDQISHDLVFEKEFELSHSSKNASVYFTGYKIVSTDEIPSDFDDSESEEEEVEEALKVKSNAEKVERKAKVKALKANKVEQDADDDDDSDDDDYEDNDGDDSDDEEMVEAEEDSDDDEDDNSEEDEETPKKAANGKKRPADPVTKAAVSEKKAKLANPADGKKGGDAKKDSPTKSGKKQQTPKSGVSVSCKSCSKTFYSEGALDSHTKAKHAAK